MTPDFLIKANDQDITDLIRDRLESVTITDKPGLEADECEITLDDRDNRVAFPPKGATLEVSFGYKELANLTFVGSYIVDEIEVSGPPKRLVIRAKPIDIAKTMKSQRRHAWENTTLAQVVTDIAERNGYKPVCNVDVAIPRVDQVNESDMHFITRIAPQYGATATIKRGEGADHPGALIVAARGAGKTAYGRDMQEIKLREDDLASYSLTFPDRSAYGSVSAAWHNNKTGERVMVTLPNPNGEPGPNYTERHIFPNPEAAQAQIKSRTESLNRATMTGKLDLMRGRADVGPEHWVRLIGIKPDVDGRYLVESVEHNFSRQAWQTVINLNAGNEGKSKVGKKADRTADIIAALPPP